MKKIIALMLILCFICTLAFANGNGETSSKTDSKQRTIRIYTNRSEAHVAYTLWKTLAERYQEEVNPNVKFEFETVSNLDQYKDKLKLYIAGNELPDVFQIDKGPLAMELASKGKLVDIDAELRRIGMIDDLDEGCRKYVEFDNGQLYIFPESRYGNTIFYWKDKFQAAGITEEPKTYSEFLDACEKLKAAGEVPFALTGKASWNPLHLMCLPSFSVTGNKWINDARSGKVAFADISVVWDSVNFLEAMVKNGYFPKGFQNMDYTDVMNGFLGGQYAMAWAQSLYIPKMEQAYAEGKLGFLQIPMNENYDGDQLATMAIQSGISWCFNQEKYDETLRDFFEFVMKNYTEESYKIGLFSPFNSDLPNGVSQMTLDYYTEMKKQTICWINWDDACDPVTCQTMDDLIKEFVSGIISAKEFVNLIDESVQENGIDYFK